MLALCPESCQGEVGPCRCPRSTLSGTRLRYRPKRAVGRFEGVFPGVDHEAKLPPPPDATVGIPHTLARQNLPRPLSRSPGRLSGVLQTGAGPKPNWAAAVAAKAAAQLGFGQFQSPHTHNHCHYHGRGFERISIPPKTFLLRTVLGAATYPTAIPDHRHLLRHGQKWIIHPPLD